MLLLSLCLPTLLTHALNCIDSKFTGMSNPHKGIQRTEDLGTKPLLAWADPGSDLHELL